MLRALVLLLLLANVLFFAWSEHWLAPLLGPAAREREPERLTRQVQPDAVALLPPEAASAVLAEAASAAALAAQGTCLEAGPFSDTDIAAAEQAIAELPTGSWHRISVDLPGSYLVYMGRYPNRDALQKKSDELRRLKIGYEEVKAPAELENGLSLGHFNTREEADASLAAATQRGVRSARVVVLAPPRLQHRLRVERATAPVAAQIVALPTTALAGGFDTCKQR
ncbi:hypothetical protein V4F39_14235 [Aquincola sp. MAHUQ-54]|uniref:SPOR domain-containing protein n=1 Tax=Aquincola agrisoli TaxID=3119538 RepID=A0AAW9QCY0_9BURK